MMVSVSGNLPSTDGICPACGEPNGCQSGSAGGDAKTCWCFDVKIGAENIRRIARNFPSAGCLCGPCLAAAAGDPEEPSVPGRDYYITAAGTLVFTAAYHLRRGSCCDNACRHCPYRGET
jgi:hypothetical protein